MEKSDQNKALVVFQDKKIRRTWHNDEWWFSVVRDEKFGIYPWANCSHVRAEA